MKYNFKVVLNSLLVASLISSCTNKHSENAKVSFKECIKLNNSGVKYLTNYPMSGEPGLNKSIVLFQQAIKCDSTYLNAYVNLSNAYDHKRLYDKELVIYKKILILSKNDPSFIMMNGMLFEKMGNIDSASKLYNLANSSYKERLVKDPNDISLIKGVVLLKAVTNGKDQAIKELNEQIKIHPNLSSKLSVEYEFYKYFDQHAYIFGLTRENSVPHF